MLLKEYEGKKILKEYGILIPKGNVSTQIKMAIKIAQDIGKDVVLKAQVEAGGRSLSGGVIFAKNEKEVEIAARKLFERRIRGLKVEEILIEEKIETYKEYYISIILDRAKKSPVLVGTTEGGVNIERLHQENPDMISQLPINSLIGVHGYHGYDLFSQFNLPIKQSNKISQVIRNLYKIFIDKEAFLVEINPLFITKDFDVIAGDCKIIIDPEASYYIKKNIIPRYTPLDGSIGILANGAGLAMATMDVVKELGGSPANFLEIGGDFYKKAGESLKHLLKSNKNLKGILVNLFGAYARTDIIVLQIVDVLKKNKVNIPIVFRIRGNGENKARFILKKELNINAYLNIEEATMKLLDSIQGEK